MHKMHLCPNMKSDAFAKAHGWPHEEIPLNVDLSKVDGQPLHSTCPYCGMSTDDMKEVPPEDAILLNVNLRGRAAQQGGRPEAQAKQENAMLAAEMRKLRESNEQSQKMLASMAEVIAAFRKEQAAKGANTEEKTKGVNE